jgi:hypothetical protein
MSEVKYYFLGDTGKARTNVITIAYVIEETVTSSGEVIDVIRFGVAYSCVSDVYNKQLGKRIALNRFNDEPRRVIVKDKNFNTYLKSIVGNIINNEAPNWAYRLIESSFEI